VKRAFRALRGVNLAAILVISLPLALGAWAIIGAPGAPAGAETTSSETGSTETATETTTTETTPPPTETTPTETTPTETKTTPPPPPPPPPPTPTVNQLATRSSNATPSFSGSTNEGSGTITVLLYEGTLSNHTLIGRLPTKISGKSWTSGKVGSALTNGPYGAVAVQENSDGKGESGPMLFEVFVPPPPAPTPTTPTSPTKTTTGSTSAPASVATGTSAAVSHPGAPVAQFKWFPAVPQTGEIVSLVSISTDLASPITGTAWALSSSGPFQAGGVLLTTTFSTPGGHVVRLRVTNASGVSSVATETINVISATAPLMQPFPVVRLAGTETSFGVRLGALRVQQLPLGAKISVRCRGRGCPIKFATRVAKAGKHGVSPVEFPRFEQGLRFGVVLEIMVSKPGEIGKYTRFVVRRGKLPERVDMCLNPAGAIPFVCPSS
jgi:hypothetical protein